MNPDYFEQDNCDKCSYRHLSTASYNSCRIVCRFTTVLVCSRSADLLVSGVMKSYEKEVKGD